MANRRQQQSFSLFGAAFTVERYAHACGVRVRSARLDDAQSIIQLNKYFRCLDLPFLPSAPPSA